MLPRDGRTCLGLRRGADKTLDWKQERTWIGDPLISGHSGPSGPASAAGHKVLQRSCALGLWQGTISRWVGPGLIAGLTPHHPAPKIAVEAGRRLADSFDKANGRVGSCARFSAVANARWSQRGYTGRLHKVSCSQSVEPRTPNKPGGAIQPVQPCLVHQIAN